MLPLKITQRISLVLFTLLVCLLLPLPSPACITAILPDTSSAISFAPTASLAHTIAYSFDWTMDFGFVATNLRDVAKTAITQNDMKHNKPYRWTSKYTSLTLNQFDYGLTMSGVNEQGVVITTMRNFNGQNLPEDKKKPYINSYQFAQLILDRSADVNEALDILNDVHVVHLMGKSNHFVICDAKGECAFVEFIAGTQVVYRGSQISVRAIANNSYEKSLAQIKSLQENLQFEPQDDLRMFNADMLLKNYKTASQTPHFSRTDFAKLILDKTPYPVSQYVHQQVIYEIEQSSPHSPPEIRMHLRSSSSPSWKSIRFDRDFFGFGIKADKTPMRLDIAIDKGGDVTNLFSRFTKEDRLFLIENSDVWTYAITLLPTPEPRPLTEIEIATIREKIKNRTIEAF